jgi:predicted peroxiredoxin
MPVTTTRSRLAILLWAATPERAELCATPFLHAAVAAALDCEVEIHFSGPATRLLVAGVAEQLFSTPDRQASIYSFMQQASSHGVRFVGCAMALRAHLAPEEATIAEYDGRATMTDFVLRALDPEWSTLVY